MTNHNLKTIIVGVDFSKYSTCVVKQAQQLAAKLALPIIYVHVFEDELMGPWELTPGLSKPLHFYRAQVRTKYGLKSDDTVVVKTGQAFTQILAVARRFKHPLIVVGHRGKTPPFTSYFIGSTAERLALRSPYPVWIHRGSRVIIPKEILIPADLTLRTNHAFKSVKTMGLRKNLSIELYHVLQPPLPLLDYSAWSKTYKELTAQNVKNISAYKKRFPKLKIIESSGDVSDEIEKHARKFDLIAITPREHKGRFSSFGSVTSKLVRKGNTSVLVVP